MTYIIDKRNEVNKRVMESRKVEALERIADALEKGGNSEN